jgi:hypothetical protein
MVEQDLPTMIGERSDEARFQFGAAARGGERFTSDIEIVRHRAIKFGPARRTVAGKQCVVVKGLGALQGGRPPIEGSLAYEDVNTTVDQVLRDQDAVVRKPDHQGILRLRMLKVKEFKTNAIDRLNSRRDDLPRPFGAQRNGMAVFFMLLSCDPIADGVDLGGDGGECIDRTREGRRAEKMILMVMGDVKARDRLAEACRMGKDLAGIDQGILRIDDDESICGLHDMAVDAPAVIGGGVGVNANVAACGSTRFLQARSASVSKLAFSKSCAAICWTKGAATTEKDVKGCKSLSLLLARQIY